jgi:hypothetical protein
MTSRTDQLFLELCLLSLRYSEEEIEQVALLRKQADEVGIRRLVTALHEIRDIISGDGSAKSMTKKRSAETVRKKNTTNGPRDKPDSEPFLNLARTLMRK